MSTKFHPEIFMPTSSQFATILNENLTKHIPRIQAYIFHQTDKHIIEFKNADTHELENFIKSSTVSQVFIIEVDSLIDGDLLYEATDLLIYVEKFNETITVTYFNPLALISSSFDIDRAENVIDGVMRAVLKSIKTKYELHVNIVTPKHDWSNIACLLHSLKYYWEMFKNNIAVRSRSELLSTCPANPRDMISFYAQTFYPMLRKYMKNTLHGIIESDTATIRIASNTFYLKKSNRCVIMEPFSAKIKSRLSLYLSIIERDGYRATQGYWLHNKKNVKEYRSILLNRTSGEILAYGVIHILGKNAIPEIYANNSNDGYIVAKILVDFIFDKNVTNIYAFINTANVLFSYLGFKWIEKNDRGMNEISREQEFIPDDEYPQYIKYDGKTYGVMVLKK